MSDETGAVLPPETTPEQLAALAAERPDLWGAISNHPACYEGLRQWIGEQQGALAAAHLQSTQTAQATTQPVQPAQPEVFRAPVEATQAQPPKPKNRKGFAIVASAVAAALVLAGTGTALAMTGTWPFGDGGVFSAFGGGATTVADSEDELGFSQGVERMWTVDSSDYVTPTVGELGQDFSYLRAPFTRGSIARFEADTPVATSSAVLFNARAEESKLVLVSAATGETLLEKDLGDRKAVCVADEHTADELFFCVLYTGSPEDPSMLARVGADGAYAETPLDRGYSRVAVGDGRVIVAGWGSGVLAVDRDFSRLWQNDDLKVGADYGIDVAAERVLVRGNSGWALLDDAGRMLARASVTSVYDGGDGACDARLTDSGALFVATGDDSCVQNAAGVNWWGFGDNLSGTEIFTVDGKDYVFGNDPEQGSRLARFPGPDESGTALEYLLDESARGQLVGVISGRQPAIVTTEQSVLTTYSVVDGEQLASWTVEGESAATLLDDEGTVLVGSAAYDAYTGEPIWSLDSAEDVGGWVTGAGLLMLGGGCPDCSIAGGSYTSSTLTLFAPDGSGGASLSTLLSDARAGSATQAAVPDFIPECPGDTVLLAWMELEDGWVVVCGVDIDTPSYVSYKSGEYQRERLSLGASKPDGDLAKSSVTWDAAQKRYIAAMADGSKLTLDYTIGTATLRDGETNSTVQEQHRFIRYVFVPLGGELRGEDDSAGESGAFDVRAPEATSEDQIRYMIEVLEKAYEGRALVKDALPKLAGCTAGAGGYADTIAAMKSVRDNRAELLQALDAMPVDKIPEGKQLLADLTEAIDLSHQANVEYVSWAEAANASGCAQLSAAGKAAADASDAPKERFAARWNRVVAPAYGVRTFDAWYI